jgi:hypothetical protein
MIKIIIISSLALGSMIYLVYQMVSTGRVRKKGAKKIRKRILPFFYGKTSIFATKVQKIDA